MLEQREWDHEINLLKDCYDLRFGSGCNLGKDLSREVEMSQLVKHKNTRLYLQLYIPIDNEDIMWQTYISDIIKHEEN